MTTLMSIIPWIAGAACAAVVLVMLLGVFLPRSLTGTTLFLRELKKRGVDISKLDPGFVRDVIDLLDQVSVAGGMLPGESSRITYFEKSVMRAVDAVTAITSNQPVYEGDPVVMLARKYRVQESLLG